MQVATSDLLAAIGAAVEVTERRSTMPILASVAIEPAGDRMVARATDLDVELAADLCAAPKRGAFVGAITDPRALIKFLRGVRSDEIILKDAGRDDGSPGATIVGSGFTGEIGLLPADDMPRGHRGAVGWRASLPASAIDVLLRVAGAMSKEDTRYYLRGVHIKHVGEWTYRFSATDGHRLYFADVQLPDASPSFPQAGVIVPDKAMTMLSRLRAKNDDRAVAFDISRSVAANDGVDWTAGSATSARLAFAAAGDRAVVMMAKVVDGTFPDTDRVIPKPEAATTIVTLATAELRRASAALSSASSYRALKLTIDPLNGCTIGVKYGEIGMGGTFSLGAEVRGAPLSIGFNGRYIVDLLTALKSERVTLHLTADSSPVLAVDPDGGAIAAVLMPMRF